MRMRISVALLSLATASNAPAQSVPKDATGFTEHVAAQFRRELPGVPVGVKGPLTLTVGELQANLDRIFAFCSGGAPGCEREIANYVKSATQVQKDRSAPPTRDAVRVVIRTQAYVTASQKVDTKGGVKLQTRLLAGTLVQIVAIDTPRAIRMYADSDGKALELAPDDAFKLGLANLRKTLKPLMQIAKTTQPGQIGTLTGDAYHPSRLALLDTWAPLAKAHNGKLVVVAPATDALLYVGDDSPVALDALRTLARNVMSRAPNRLSDQLMRWTPRRWEVVK